jgi:hypothetical protein
VPPPPPPLPTADPPAPLEPPAPPDPLAVAEAVELAAELAVVELEEVTVLPPWPPLVLALLGPAPAEPAGASLDSLQPIARTGKRRQRQRIFIAPLYHRSAAVQRVGPVIG